MIAAALVSLVACFGAPSDYIAAFDAEDGTTDGQVSYPEPRWYDEQQSWATSAGMTPGHHSQHMHMGRCIPNGETWSSSSRRIDVSYTFHNAAGNTVTSAGMSFLWGDPNAGPTSPGYKATTSQVAQLQAAVDASGDAVTHAYQSYTIAPAATNGFKEVRSSLALKGGSVFPSWILDTRWYETEQHSGLPSGAGITGQIAVRNRSHVQFPKPGQPSTTVDDYHHSGWCGADGTPFGSTQTMGSALLTSGRVSAPWTGSQTVCLYVTDGGGPATLMIDPDFHHHYTTPTPACPNVDANGNCLGVWYTSLNIFSGPGAPQNIPATIPAGVVAELASGLHRLVFKSDDFPECVRRHQTCPPDVRGSWTNISTLPFTVPA